MKILVEYDKSTGEIALPDGSTYFVAKGLSFKAHEEPNTPLKELVAAGMSADDLIKLKHGGVI